MGKLASRILWPLGGRNPGEGRKKALLRHPWNKCKVINFFLITSSVCLIWAYEMQ